MPRKSAASALAVVPPLAVIKAGFQLEARVRLNVPSKVPLVTPRGKPANEGTCVATPAVPAPGTAVALWMCDAVVFASRPLKVTCTRRVWAVLS